MDQKLNALLAKIEELEAEFNAELARRSAQLRFGLEKGRIKFEEEIRRQHEVLRTSLWTYIRRSNPLAVITAPIIYALIIPLVMLDVFLAAYQATCFRAYGIKRVKRSDYIAFDRLYLSYLNPIEKLNCAYCSYANGLIAYAGEIASLTEAYWCPIKHARRLQGAHKRYREFADYGDADAYKKLNKKTD